jgi:membrane protease YdiL (CAAX protease family)
MVTWRLVPTIAVVLVGVVVGAFAAVPVFALLGETAEGGASGFSELAQGVVVDVVWMGILIVWLRARHPGWQAALRLLPHSRIGREAAISAGLGLLVRIVAGIVAAIVVVVLATVTNEDVVVPEQVVEGLHGFQLVVFALFAVVVAPITEEFVFRGLIYRSVRDRHGFAWGAIVSAMMFGAIHWPRGEAWPEALALTIPLFVTGLGLAWVYERRKTLFSPIVGHAAFNLIAVAVIVFDALRPS